MSYITFLLNLLTCS